MNESLELDLNILQGLSDRLGKQALEYEKRAGEAQEKARLLLGSIEAANHYLTIATTLRIVSNLILEEANSREPA